MLEEVTPQNGYVEGSWGAILWGLHVEHSEIMPDEFNRHFNAQAGGLKLMLEQGNFSTVYGALEYIIRHQSCPEDLAHAINVQLKNAQAAYRIVDGDTFAPYTSDEEIEVVNDALAAIHSPQLVGAHAHYKAAIEELTAGHFADSMRESHQAVESMTKMLTGESTLQEGVKALAKKGLLHVTVQQGIEKVAAWTNAVAGIRHANEAAEAAPQVNEDDAVFLLGVCGATISYLKRLGEKAGLIK